MKVIIFGAGISGLTAAHELIEKGFDVTIYEKDTVVGGMARSLRTVNGVPTEHSWRGYAPFYYNTFEIMKRIPINDNILSENINSISNTSMPDNIEKKTNRLITSYNNKKYDLTDFVKHHPGGNIIMEANGKNVEDIWEEYNVSWHKNNKKVQEELKKYRIEEFTQKTVYDNISKKGIDFNLLKNNKKQEPTISIIDYPYLGYLFGKTVLSENRRQLYYHKPFNKKLKKNLTASSYHYLVDFLLGPGYGFDKNSMSLGHTSLFIEYMLYTGNKSWSVLNQPTSEGWLNPWKNYLESRGVKFIFNAELTKMNYNYNNEKITNVEVNYTRTRTRTLVTGDIYIVAINPFEYEKILQESNIPEFKRYQKMNIPNNQISFRIGFNKKINFKNDNDAFVLIDSPYNITFYPQDQHWENNIELGMNGEIKSLWSGTCVLPYNPGSLTGKSAMSLTIDKLKEEILYQIFQCKSLFFRIKKNNNHELKKDDVIFMDIFSDFYETNSGLKTKNKKWVNNLINESYRPNNKTNFSNLYIAGSHTKTSINLWTMESAVESGKLVSNIILKRYNKPLTFIYIHGSKWYLKPFQKIDNLLYKLYLPQLIDTLIILIVIYLIYKIYIIHH